MVINIVKFFIVYKDQKYLESFEMLCWRRMEKISWTDHVRNEEVLLRVNESGRYGYIIRPEYRVPYTD